MTAVFIYATEHKRRLKMSEFMQMNGFKQKSKRIVVDDFKNEYMFLYLRKNESINYLCGVHIWPLYIDEPESLSTSDMQFLQASVRIQLA